MLYLVATPIGNLSDITARAIEVLHAVDIIAAEDTRVTRKLTSRFKIKTPLISYHEHSGPSATADLVRRMSDSGQSIAFVTDAGSPGVSDPGVDLVAASIAAGVRVIPVPGASAVIAAVTASGLPSARFVFEGFLPRTKGTRLKKLEALALEVRTVVFYESAPRLAATLAEIALAFGAERPVCVAREMTKIFEEFRRGGAAELAGRYRQEKTRGECVIVVAGASSDRRVERMVCEDSDCAAGSANENATPRGKDLVRLLAEELGAPRREVYQMVLALKTRLSDSR